MGEEKNTLTLSLRGDSFGNLLSGDVDPAGSRALRGPMYDVSRPVVLSFFFWENPAR